LPATKLIAGRINHLVAGRHGYVLYNVHDQFVGRSFDLYGEFSEYETDLFGQFLRPGDVALDVGANIGAHTLYFAQAVGRQGKVLAFEPQRFLFQTLCANMALNSLTNVYCYQLAVGEAPGWVRLPVINYEQEGNFGGVSVARDEVGETVPVMTLDSLGLSQCRLIKVDVEGMERSVLAGARQTIERTRPILYVENDRSEKACDLVRFIDSLGYEVYGDAPLLYRRDNFFDNETNVFDDIRSVNLLCVPRESDIVLTGFTKWPLDQSEPPLECHRPK
jgi:FkbM family methyltransferase